MNIEKQTLIIASGTLIIGGLLGYLIGHHGGWRGDGRYEGRDHEKSERYGDTGMNGMRQMNDGSKMENDMGMMGHDMMVTNEKEFITEMIPHHQEAIDTAKQVLERGGTTPEVKALAEGIVTAQEKEIADMKSWYEAWYETPYATPGTYKHMMRDLSKLSGKELDKAFLTDMIPHHMGAIMMAHSVQGALEHNETKTLTKNIIDSQLNEIETMRGILRNI